MSSNNTINSGNEKRRAFVAPLFTAGYGERYADLVEFKHLKETR